MFRKIPVKQTEDTIHIKMDTKLGREGIHLWICQKIPLSQEDIKSGKYDSENTKYVSTSIHLNREDCKALIAEINERLF